MKRVALLVVLLCVYGAFLERRLASGGAGRMDVVAPRAREVEDAIASNRFSDALPIALEMRDAHPAEPLVALWLAAIYRGLDRPSDEAAAWERFIELGSSPADACPGLAEAYARFGDLDQGLRAYARCVRLDPLEPERHIDLADALERAGRLDDAREAFGRAAELDPGNPALARRVAPPPRGKAGAP